MVQLWRSKIISLAEYDDLRSVMDNETDARVRTEQVNVAVLRSLLRNGCRDFLKFLQLLEGDCQIHLVNYITNSPGELTMIFVNALI